MKKFNSYRSRYKQITFAHNNGEVIFSVKNKKKKGAQQNVDGKKIIDLTSYISPEMVQSDVNGSYTGVTADTYFHDEYDIPVQDADDL